MHRDWVVKFSQTRRQDSIRDTYIYPAGSDTMFDARRAMRSQQSVVRDEYFLRRIFSLYALRKYIVCTF